MLALNIKYSPNVYKIGALILTYLVIFCYFLPNFLRWDINLYTGLLLTPYICNLQLGKFSLRYLAPTLIAFVGCIFVPVKTLFFIAVVFSAILMIETILGKLDNAFILLAFLVSPVFRYLISMVDFPIRLWLTSKVTDLLSIIGIKATAAGNIIELDQYSFSVDPACAGLNMLVMSLIICLFTVVHYQKKLMRELSWSYLFGLFILTICLNILSNYFRILLLVVFKIMPSTLFHDFVGIACLATYVILPLILFTKFACHFLGKEKPNDDLETSTNHPATRFSLMHFALIISLVLLGTRIVEADTLTVTNHPIQINGFKGQQITGGIQKLESKDALIYLKPSPFYIPGHDPKICWAGSGYAFTNIKNERILGTTILTAELTKKGEKIYAAWWYTDGKTQTVDQLLWRWKALTNGSSFYLVNVNTLSKAELARQTKILLSNPNYLSGI